MSSLRELLQPGRKKILSIFITAGYPQLDSTNKLILALQDAGADLVEVGIPYSDPLADGPVIQNTSSVALANGMSIAILFEQLQRIGRQVRIPLVLMGYLNPILQYGVEKFCLHASRVGISGLIIPDLPLEEYQASYQRTFQRYSLPFISLVCPSTSDERMRLIDKLSDGFIYAVSTSSTTGKEAVFGSPQAEYLKHLKNLNLSNPILVGFGIHNAETFEFATSFCDGAIIGSAFLKSIASCVDFEDVTSQFIRKVRVSS
ncbi:MAG TPA: tryptophan synthase subunit alpha [Tenuifilaceae bacterium]|nr:tryptophan synthase subunit alpha [Bacteroidales bacterium]HOC37467.1 tryptophan synthase subunit alpha [Tenuifilaceae bacterium]HOG73148.1 tryptophan synthase subunit alpha [Tenuifilaceae bacterium]